MAGGLFVNIRLKPFVFCDHEPLSCVEELTWRCVCFKGQTVSCHLVPYVVLRVLGLYRWWPSEVPSESALTHTPHWCQPLSISSLYSVRLRFVSASTLWTSVLFCLAGLSSIIIILFCSVLKPLAQSRSLDLCGKPPDRYQALIPYWMEYRAVCCSWIWQVLLWHWKDYSFGSCALCLEMTTGYDVAFLLLQDLSPLNGAIMSVTWHCSDPQDCKKKKHKDNMDPEKT